MVQSVITSFQMYNNRLSAPPELVINKNIKDVSTDQTESDQTEWQSVKRNVPIAKTGQENINIMEVCHPIM